METSYLNTFVLVVESGSMSEANGTTFRQTPCQSMTYRRSDGLGVGDQIISGPSRFREFGGASLRFARFAMR
jgi:hypothetical protein